ncbi:MAG: 3-deoxy-8-phosphooctulonate synthase [Endomicrobiales bacterium]|nr:3-deoxy-8-phosphooctulonate synthase [Endomicrobiales bacterium]
MKQRTVKLKQNRIEISNDNKLVLIAGPCVIENRKQALGIAARLKSIASRFDLPFIFKASYDKANRTSIDAYRGPGIEEGLEILDEIKTKYKVPVLTDVHCVNEVDEAGEVADIIQIPAFLSRQTDLLLKSAESGCVVNVKKGQFMAPNDVSNIIKKIERTGNKKILLTERGASFGYNNLITDIRSLVIMKNTGYPVIFDATHSVQLPGGMGKSSGGQREFVKPLAKAAASVGIAGIFVEVHPNPKKALSDGANSLSLNELPDFLKIVLKIDRLIKKG